MQKILNYWNAFEKYTAGVLGFSMTILILYGVFLRYFFSGNPEWIEDVVIYLSIFAVYIAASLIAEDGGHVSASFVIERLPEKYRRVVFLLTALAALAFCMLVTYLGFIIVKVAYTMDERSTSAIRIPMWIPYLAVPMGTFLISLRYVRKLYLTLFNFASVETKKEEVF
jgi:C4-dicarboxylate transporter DctQ subunit